MTLVILTHPQRPRQKKKKKERKPSIPASLLWSKQDVNGMAVMKVKEDNIHNIDQVET